MLVALRAPELEVRSPPSGSRTRRWSKALGSSIPASAKLWRLTTAKLAPWWSLWQAAQRRASPSCKDAVQPGAHLEVVRDALVAIEARLAHRAAPTAVAIAATAPTGELGYALVHGG